MLVAIPIPFTSLGSPTMPRTPDRSWVRQLSAIGQASITRPPRRGRHTFRPHVEALEPRRTPTVSFLAQQTFAVGTSPTYEAVGDFNGDGKPDLVEVNSGDKTVSVLLNTAAAGAGGAVFAAQQTLAVGAVPNGVVVADFNGDGKPDLAVANSGDKSGRVGAVVTHRSSRRSVRAQ
jgi:hypothetical protein